MIVQNEANPAQLSIRSSGAARLRAWARSAPEWKIRRTRNFFEVEDVQPARACKTKPNRGQRMHPADLPCVAE
jgi:hypothetical protein